MAGLVQTKRRDCWALARDWWQRIGYRSSGLSQRADDARRIAGNNRPRGRLERWLQHAAGSDHTAAADVAAFQNGHAIANQHVIANYHRPGPLVTEVAPADGQFVVVGVGNDQCEVGVRASTKLQENAPGERTTPNTVLGANRILPSPLSSVGV